MTQGDNKTSNFTITPAYTNYMIWYIIIVLQFCQLYISDDLSIHHQTVTYKSYWQCFLKEPLWLGPVSAVIDTIWTKLETDLFGTIFNRCQVSREHLSMQHLSWRHMSISAISQFWPNFEGRFLGPSLPDAICQGNIFPDNICPGDIFWPNFVGASTNFFRSKIILIKILLDTNFFLTQNVFDQLFFYPKCFWTQIFLTKNSFDPKSFGAQIFLDQNFVRSKHFGSKFVGPNCFGTENIYDPKIFGLNYLHSKLFLTQSQKPFWSKII